LPAIASALLGFYVLRKSSISAVRIIVSGLLMGVGISIMHYTGMEALRMMPPISYDPLILSLSVAIAVIASWGALLIIYQASTSSCRQCFASWWCGHHGFGDFQHALHRHARSRHLANSMCLAGAERVAPDILAIIVSLVSLLWFGGGILASLFDQRMARQNAKHWRNTHKHWRNSNKRIGRY